ncbi:14810_t:CDS:2, partial [Funneliformis mosseae]
ELVEETDKNPDAVEVDDDSNVTLNTNKGKGKNILKCLYNDKKIKEGDEIKYGKDHICFLTLINSIPCIMYNEIVHYSIDAFLQEYLKDILDRDLAINSYCSERCLFSIRGIKYNDLKDM